MWRCQDWNFYFWNHYSVVSVQCWKSLDWTNHKYWSEMMPAYTSLEQVNSYRLPTSLDSLIQYLSLLDHLIWSHNTHSVMTGKNLLVLLGKLASLEVWSWEQSDFEVEYTLLHKYKPFDCDLSVDQSFKHDVIPKQIPTSVQKYTSFCSSKSTIMYLSRKLFSWTFYQNSSVMSFGTSSVRWPKDISATRILTRPGSFHNLVYIVHFCCLTDAVT